jgi:tetratricopeptide (TPR) repeat protein
MRALVIYILIAAAAAAAGAGCQKAAAEQYKSPENLFNLATEAMVKGNDVLSIDLYYKLIDSYPDFNKYRADSIYRLGMLLYKTERYDEAEKILALFAAKFKNDDRLRNVYEKLIYIYMQEFHDEQRAQSVRALYAEKFKESPVLKDIDKTINILSTDEKTGSAVLAMNAGNIGIIKMLKTGEIDREFFPVRNYVLVSVKSPDGKFAAEKREFSGDYSLFFGAIGSKMQRIEGSTGAYAPQWAWNSKYIFFTSMDWRSKERRIRVYDTAGKKTRELFRAKGVGPLLCISPDSAKIVFTYLDKLWIMNSGGNSVALLSKNIDVKDISMIAWSREGDSIIYSKKNEKDVYYLCKLGRREIEAMQ